VNNLNVYEKALKMHEKYNGKISIKSKLPKLSPDNLKLAYTPGVAAPCMKIFKNNDDAYKYTSKYNMVAVVTDGSAVLGLGNIGAKAALPVMEGKALLFKEFGGVDAFPICIDSQDTEEIIRTVQLISPGFGGINLEDISAPRCFEIEERLKKTLDIPVFHDDQHGTAVVTLAALLNALKLVGKKKENIKVVINGAGAAGTSIAKILIHENVKEIIMCDSTGIISPDRNDLNPAKKELCMITNKNKVSGKLKDALNGADVFIGVSVAKALIKDMIKVMDKPIIFALANPEPEILPSEALDAGAVIVATGRSDFPNQINNVLGFPGIFRGTLDARAREINEEMKIAAAYALAELALNKLSKEYIIPSAFDKGVAKAVSEAVKKAAVKSGVARLFK
jgi:malate dehydrogenase (oxaloacetate-decarboxylating)